MKEIGLTGSSTEIIEELIDFNRRQKFSNNTAIFVPLSLYKKYKMPIPMRRQFVADKHIWDYDLQIGKKIKKMKLIWITRYEHNSGIKSPDDLNIKRAFTFLQPAFLRYMDKSFWNPDVITQVNLILDYHRTRKRRQGIEVFNICDLINFKMAIDDNRFEYENCEFHKIIDRTLAEHIKSNRYMKNGLFDFNEYLIDRQLYDFKVREIFEYMVCHFQNTIRSACFFNFSFDCKELSVIMNVPLFLKTYDFNDMHLIKVSTTDARGKCSEVLYELLTKTTKGLEIDFTPFGEWFYSGENKLNKISKPLARSKIWILTKNNLNFIENFINWLKLSFGKHSENIDLGLDLTHGTINGFIFNNFFINRLIISNVNLNCKLFRMLKWCKYLIIVFEGCQIENDLNERFDLIGRVQSNNIKCSFEYLEELDNVEFHYLELDEHTIAMLFSYVASVMTENSLMQFEFKNKIKLKSGVYLNIFEFRRSNVNSVVDQIEAYTKSGQRYDFYSDYNNLDDCDREEFDFYQ